MPQAATNIQAQNLIQKTPMVILLVDNAIAPLHNSCCVPRQFLDCVRNFSNLAYTRQIARLYSRNNNGTCTPGKFKSFGRREWLCFTSRYYTLGLAITAHDHELDYYAGPTFWL
jgi:hypothetical protein